MYLKGSYFSNKRTEEGLKKGREYFQRAVDTDPNGILKRSRRRRSTTQIAATFLSVFMPRCNGQHQEI
jgi:hypothetical protein